MQEKRIILKLRLMSSWWRAHYEIRNVYRTSKTETKH